MFLFKVSITWILLCYYSFTCLRSAFFLTWITWRKSIFNKVDVKKKSKSPPKIEPITSVARNKIFGGVTRCKLLRATRFFGASHDANCCAQQDFLGRHTMQIVARNVAKLELDSTSTTVARNVAREVGLCVRAFSVSSVRRPMLPEHHWATRFNSVQILLFTLFSIRTFFIRTFRLRLTKILRTY